MDDARKQLADALKAANNVLVTVSRNPSVDQLASCISLTLLLNKQGKHTAAVFSGQVPSTLEFLQPEETLEKNTDSLRDFIIALDKSKADKLRYKVEDNVVRIFITPYKTSISQDDLEFSEGDFNVDVVITLGVRQQEDLDEAITAHGRILHDATVASINIGSEPGLGTINWFDPDASSLSELITELAQSLGSSLLDQQIATALLTGIVSETDRFSNDKTSSQTMSASAALMAAGANQQLVASKLEEGPVLSLSASDSAGSGTGPTGKADGGTLRIDHIGQDDSVTDDTPADDGKEPTFELPEAATTDASTEISSLKPAEPAMTPPEPDNTSAGVSSGAKLMTEPPTMGGTLTANSTVEGLESTSDPLSLPTTDPPQLLDRKPDMLTTSEQADQLALAPPNSVPAPGPSSAWLAPPPTSSDSSGQDSGQAQTTNDDDHDRTLTELEKSLGSSHAATENVDSAREEVSRALSGAVSDGTSPDEPIQALNAQPLGGALHDNNSPAAEPPQPTDSSLPPPVPPPIPFQFGNPSPPPQP